MILIRRLPIRCPYNISSPRNISLEHYSNSQSQLKHIRSMTTSQQQIKALKQYTACDISDALLKLEVPNCGYLPDLKLYTSASDPKITIAPASTVLFVPKNATDLSSYGEGNIPAGKHYVDLTEPETIVVISQPKGQICAALGGIMALRMKVRKTQGVVVHGRVRDVEELNETRLPVG